MRSTTEPVWEEQFLLKDVTHQTLRNTTMQMSVWNYEKGSKHILLGGIRLGVGEVQGNLHDSFGEELNVWKRFLDYPNENLDFSVPLRSTLESVKRWDSSMFYWTIARKIIQLSKKTISSEQPIFEPISNLHAEKVHFKLIKLYDLVLGRFDISINIINVGNSTASLNEKGGSWFHA